MQVTIHSAKSQLSRLIEAALAGEDVVIARGAAPVVRIVPVQTGRFRFGVMTDQLAGPTPDFLAPMDEAELAAWEGRP